MDDRQSGVPEHVQDVFDHLLAARRLLVGEQEQQVDVGPWRQFTAAVTTDRRHADAVARRRIRRGKDVMHGEIEQIAQQLVDQIRVRSEEHTSELQSLMRISYAVFCLKKKKQKKQNNRHAQ